ncbi:pyridoxamine 5'-phosphate oxidase [Brachybacterium sp. DNPG3]
MSTSSDVPRSPDASRTPAAHDPAARNPAVRSPASPADLAERLPLEHIDYLAGSLADDAPADPLALFDAWLDDAFARRDLHGDISDPSAVVLASIALDEAGAPRPRTRTVLLKGRDERGFVVYTNRESAKGRELAATPQASLLFPWYALQRQVRVEGRVERVSDAESDAYFARRPRGSQLGAWASDQSRPVGSREELEARYADAEARFAGRDVPRPDYWGGLRLLPDALEFWQGRANRMHDRIAFALGTDGVWRRERLQP